MLAKLTNDSSAGIRRLDSIPFCAVSIEWMIKFQIRKTVTLRRGQCEYALYAACSERPVLIVSVRMFAFLDEKLTFKKSSALLFTSVPSAPETA